MSYILEALKKAQAGAATEEARRLEAALLGINRHAVGLCAGCGSLHEGHKRLESAAMRSKSVRWPLNGAAHAMMGTKMGGNAVLAGKSPGPGAHLTSQRDKHGALSTMATAGSEPYTSSALNSVVSIE